MNCKNVLLFLILLVSFNSCAILKTITDEEYYSSSDSQARTDSNFNKPNGCYAKCLMPPDFEVEEAEPYPVFTGAFLENTEYTEEILIQISSPGTKWVKKKADKNCLSANPEDCLVWCLVNVPGLTKTITVVTDTSKTEDYEYRNIEKVTKIEGEGGTEWRAVVCENEISSSLIRKIQLELKRRDYYIGELSSVFDPKTKSALVALQRKENLPIGNLDFDTLDFLGVEID